MSGLFEVKELIGFDVKDTARENAYLGKINGIVSRQPDRIMPIRIRGGANTRIPHHTHPDHRKSLRHVIHGTRNLHLPESRPDGKEK